MKTQNFKRGTKIPFVFSVCRKTTVRQTRSVSAETVDFRGTCMAMKCFHVTSKRTCWSTTSKVRQAVEHIIYFQDSLTIHEDKTKEINV